MTLMLTDGLPPGIEGQVVGTIRPQTVDQLAEFNRNNVSEEPLLDVTSECDLTISLYCT